MKTTMIGLIFTLALVMTVAGSVWGGLFDDVLKSVTPPSDDGTQEKQGIVEGLGGLLGVDEKKVDLIKKGIKTAASLQPIGGEEEVAIGRGVAVEAFSRFGGEYANDGLIKYISMVGQTIVEVSDRPELHFHFSILNSEEQNAFAAPGGYIFVTRGLLSSLNNEAELAGVLAHEVVHVTRRHMLETIRRGALLANVSDLTMSAMNKDPAMFANLIDHMSDILFTKGLDQKLEFEADVYGAEYVYRAGYNPQGLKDYLLTLKSQEGKTQSVFFSTHPETGERILKLDAALRRYPDAKNFPFLTKRFTNQVKRG